MTKQAYKKQASQKRPPKKAAPLTKWLPPNTFYAHTMPGLEQLAWREVQQVLPQATLVGFDTLEKKTVYSSFGFIRATPAPS